MRESNHFFYVRAPLALIGNFPRFDKLIWQAYATYYCRFSWSAYHVATTWTSLSFEGKKGPVCQRRSGVSGSGNDPGLIVKKRGNGEGNLHLHVAGYLGTGRTVHLQMRQRKNWHNAGLRTGRRSQPKEIVVVVVVVVVQRTPAYKKHLSVFSLKI